MVNDYLLEATKRLTGPRSRAGKGGSGAYPGVRDRPRHLRVDAPSIDAAVAAVLLDEVVGRYQRPLPGPHAQAGAVPGPKSLSFFNTRRRRRAESSLIEYTRACEYHIGSFGVTVTTGWPSGRCTRAAVAVCWNCDRASRADLFIPLPAADAAP
jgi:hypothetical protein